MALDERQRMLLLLTRCPPLLSGRLQKGALKPDDDEEAERQLEENLWRYYRLLPPAGKFKMRWDPFIQVSE